MTLWVLLIAGTVAAVIGIYLLRRAGPYVPTPIAGVTPAMLDALIRRTMAELQGNPEFQAHVKAFDDRARAINREIEEQITPNMTTEEIERLVSSQVRTLMRDPVGAPNKM